jgi:tetratricopeptide (TPR) repeat protein
MGFLYAIKKYNSVFIKRGLTIAVILFACLLSAILFTESGNRILNTALSEYRLTAWRNSIEMIQDKPVQGVGSGNFKIFYPAYSHSAVVDRALDTTKYLGRAHNDFIQIAAELGIPGLLLFVLIPVYGLALSRRLLCQSGNSAFHPVIIGLVGGLIAFMTSAFFSFPMQRSMPPLLVFAYCGMLVFFNSRLPAEKKQLIIRVPQLIGVVLIVAIALPGFVLMRFNFKNIICDSYYFTAVGMEKRGNNSRALSSSLEAHQYNKYRMDVLITAGRAYIATGEMQKAIEILQKVVSSNPYNLNAVFLLGVAYANSDDKENALETFRRVLQIKPDFSDARKIFFSLKAYGSAKVNLS